MRDRQAERRAATRAEIVAAAWDLCRTQGLAGLSLRDLAGRVGLRAPSLYSYFPSKHAIYDAMFAEGAQAFRDGHAGVARSDDLQTELARQLRYFVEFCTSDVVRHQLLFQRTIPGFEPSPASFAISVAELEQLSAWFASVGLGREELDLFTALGTGLVDQQLSNDPGGDRWARLVEEAAAMFAEHVQGRRAQGSGTTGTRRGT